MSELSLEKQKRIEYLVSEELFHPWIWINIVQLLCDSHLSLPVFCFDAIILFLIAAGWGAIWGKCKFWKLDDSWEEKRTCISLPKTRYLDRDCVSKNISLGNWEEHILQQAMIVCWNYFQCNMPSLIFDFLSYHDRCKDNYLSIMHATCGWLCSPSVAWAARCWWSKYKLQTCWATSGLCFASSSQLILLHSS